LKAQAYALALIDVILLNSCIGAGIVGKDVANILIFLVVAYFGIGEVIVIFRDAPPPFSMKGSQISYL
jgi:hypothetical protein